jgi:hypothetical protein
MRRSGCHIILILCFLGAMEAFPQGGGLPGNIFGGGGGGGGLGGGFPGSSSGRGGGGSLGAVTLDTSDIYYFFAERPNEVFPFSDSLLVSFHQYDPVRLQPFDFASLGNLGSAARPLFFQPTWRRGLDIGLHQFGIYQMSTADVRYYKVTQAYTQASYSQGPTQNDAFFNIRFSRNFADGLNLSLETRRINNAGAYDFQKALNSAVAAGLWYHNKYGTYDGYFSFVSNGIEQQDNGGTADTLLRDTLIPAYQVQTRLSTSNTRHANKELAYTQYFYLNRIFDETNVQRRVAKREQKKAEKEKRKKDRLEAKHSSGKDSTQVADSLKMKAPGKSPLQQKPSERTDKGQKIPPPPSGPPAAAVKSDTLSSRRPIPGAQPAIVPGQRAYTLYHQIAWRTGSFKFSDTKPDTAFYGDFLVDQRGIRHYLEAKKLENTFKLQTFKLKRQVGKDSTGRSLPRESDLLEVGLVHTMHFLNQEAVDTGIIQNLFLTGRLNFSPGERLRIQTYAHLGIGADAGDFRLGGELFLNLKKIGSLRLEVVNQLYSPSLIHHRFYVTEQEIWKNDFGKTLETSLIGTYSLPSIHFSLAGQYHLLNKLVYFGPDSRPGQSGAFSIFQLMAQKDFHVGAFHLENWVGLQQTTSDVLPLPQFYSKHSFYIEKKIFKKVMLAKAGLDARLASAYTPPSYHPLTGQFYLQEDWSPPFTPLVDAFLSFRVKTFRFFFKIENILPFATKTYYYQTSGYPLPYGMGNGGMRMGISWRLVD